MLAEILLQKYEYHVPFYRQVKAFCHLGIRNSESTLSNWFKPVCTLLRPLYEQLKRQVLAADYIQVNENRSLVEHALKEIQELYLIERMADKEELSYQARADLRQKLATPILESLEKWMEQTYPDVLPKSHTGQAIAYAYPLWSRMKRCLQDGRIKIDNNLAKNVIRPLTISRKNFLFCGNHEAAENTAVICSLLATCKAQEVNSREWLNDVITQLSAYLEKESVKCKRGEGTASECMEKKGV